MLVLVHTSSQIKISLNCSYALSEILCIYTAVIMVVMVFHVLSSVTFKDNVQLGLPMYDNTIFNICLQLVAYSCDINKDRCRFIV